MYKEIMPQLGEYTRSKHTLFITQESSWASMNLDSNPLTEMLKKFLPG